MIQVLKKYSYIIYTSYKNYTVYSYDILGKILTFGFRVSVIIILYKAIFGAYGVQNGFTFEQATWALIFAQIFVSSNVNITNEIDLDIKSGKISVQLLNPFSYVVFKFLELFPQMIFNFSFLLVVGFLIGYFFLGSFDFTWISMIAGLIMSVASIFLYFLGYMIIGLLGFYTEDTEAFRWIYSKLIMILGGNVLPISFLPSLLQTIAFLSPFAYTGYTIGITLVNFHFYEFIKSLGIIIAWIFIYLIVIKTLYSSAIKRLNINGG